jgi:nucleotide-binding universal stress UspA family protein
MYKNILVATDGSESSRSAFAHAVNIARKFEGKIILLHVTFTPQSYLGNNLAYGLNISEYKLKELAKSAIDETIQGIDFSGVQVTHLIVSGSPAQKIVEVVNKEKVDLVVMGSTGHGPFSGAFLGSVSQRVLSRAACPVMVVKDPNAGSQVDN